MRRVVPSLAIPTHILIRPRGGDFAYDSDELAVMLDDIAAARDLKAAGIVLGALRADGTIDVATTARLIDRARPLFVTFHRAFDLVTDPHEALDDLLRLGVDLVLTSGGPGPARENLTRLRYLVDRAAGRIAVMAGGSISENDVPALLDSTGVEEIHFGSSVTLPTLSSGPFGSRPAAVDPERVRRIVRLVHSL